MTPSTQAQTDPRLLFPYVCEITPPAGPTVALHHRTTGPVNIRLERIASEEIRSLSEGLGIVLMDPTRCGGGAASLPPGYRITLTGDQNLSIEYARTRDLRALAKGDVSPRMLENLTDRYTPRQWENLILLSPPSFPIKADSRALGQSYCWLERLELLWIREVNP